MLAKVRTDLEKAGEFPAIIQIDRDLHMPTLAEHDKWYHSWQPEHRDNFEYNLILSDKEGRLFLAHSIDFEFLDFENGFFERN